METQMCSTATKEPKNHQNDRPQIDAILDTFIWHSPETVTRQCIKAFYLPTDAQKSCFKRILKFTLK